MLEPRWSRLLVCWSQVHIFLLMQTKQLKPESPRLNLAGIINHNICAKQPDKLKRHSPLLQVHEQHLQSLTSKSGIPSAGQCEQQLPLSWRPARNKHTAVVNQCFTHSDALLNQHLLPNRYRTETLDNSHPQTSSSSLAVKEYRAQRSILHCALQEFPAHRNHIGKNKKQKNVPFGVVCYTAVDD